MSTVLASYTPVRRCPVLLASSGIPVASRSWRPAAAFPSSAAVKCRRPLSVSCALPEKQRPTFSIPPTALLYPVPPPDPKERWDIKEEKDYVKLWFQVPGLSEEDLEITAGEDMLEIKRKDANTGSGGGNEASSPADVHGVGSFHVRLLMTKEYDSNNVTAELKAGMLEVTVTRAKQRAFKRVEFGPKGSGLVAVRASVPSRHVQSNTQTQQKEAGVNQMQSNAVKEPQDGAGQYKTQDGQAQTKPNGKNGVKEPQDGAGQNKTQDGQAQTKPNGKNAVKEPQDGAGQYKTQDGQAQTKPNGKNGSR